MTELRSAGEKLGKLELSKTQAIQNEDYGKAKKKKTQMEEYRTQVMIENRVDDLLEKNGVSQIGCDTIVATSMKLHLHFILTD